MNLIEREIATYSVSKLDRLIRRELWFFPETERRWKNEGWDGSTGRFLYDEDPYTEELINLVGIDIPIVPAFQEEILETNEEYILLKTSSGAVEQFPKDKGRWTEAMPLYVRHPVEEEKDWYEKIKPRLDPDTPERWGLFYEKGDQVAEQVKRGEKLYGASCIGGYMFLRAMMGPENTLLAFYDHPAMIHDMMKTWLRLIKTCLMRVQKKVPFFKLLMGEDIAYKNGLLISPAMVEEFLFPYYDNLIRSLRSNRKERLYMELDTDGNLREVIPLYTKVGIDAFGPFEVAAGNDVLEYAEKYPEVVILGGIDKRILGSSKEAIRQELERIIPAMVKRGGYIPTCDHTVPSSVPYENYLYYREMVTKLGSNGK